MMFFLKSIMDIPISHGWWLRLPHGFMNLPYGKPMFFPIVINVINKKNRGESPCVIILMDPQMIPNGMIVIGLPTSRKSKMAHGIVELNSTGGEQIETYRDKEKKQPGWWFQPLWTKWKSVGTIIPNLWKKTCSKPPTSSGSLFAPVIVMFCFFRGSLDLKVLDRGSSQFFVVIWNPLPLAYTETPESFWTVPSSMYLMISHVETIMAAIF